MPKLFADWNERHFALIGSYQRFALRWNLWETSRMGSILEEIWKIKDDLAREAGYDIHRLCENTRKWMAEHPHSGPIVHTAEELQKLASEEERTRAQPSAFVLNEDATPVTPARPTEKG